MAFPEKMLHPGEQIILELHPHWWALMDGIGSLLIAVALGVGSLVLGIGVLQWVALAVLVLALALFAQRYLRWVRTDFIVTSERVIFQQGMVSRRGTQMPLEKINTVDFQQSVFERLIGAGDLVIESGSERGVTTFNDVRRPMDVQQTIQEQMDRHEKLGQGGGRPATVPEQIAQLADLRDRGLISDEEFETKKNDLLGRM